METPVLLPHAIEDSTDIFGNSGGGVEPPQTTPLGTPLFPLQQWLHERSSMLRYTHFCLSCLILVSVGQELLIIWQLVGLSHLLQIKRMNVWHWGDSTRSTTRKTSLIASLLVANPTRAVL